MSKAWWRQLLDEGAIPALALAFAVGQSPWGSMGFRDRLLPFQSQKDEYPTATGPAFPTVTYFGKRSQARVHQETPGRALQGAAPGQHLH